jgi:hypothetical protein
MSGDPTNRNLANLPIIFKQFRMLLQLLHLCIVCLRGNENGDVGVGVLPEREEVFICDLCVVPRVRSLSVHCRPVAALLVFLSRTA